ncbi:TPA: HNH endonuclease [Streptococcus suis]|uniref:Prophage LambdaSa2, HNH endonuclease family protein n=1 Tax=Streptococcus suis TaxID=1307 RepID=A0A0Z8PXE3_STRSU|nr:NUMOD4 domain-containing protein [Streptococcus suis]MCK3958312.1 hypothetical protein [Streptococcus suis]NQG29729.1 hypothetical protein [Streptococcus suis]CYW53522.1 prophage LambdaSa2%2C HNH endonuclease family protein [Streptococcus suis]HEL9644061.1 HNH endonuclease [Streptococcus suis]HEM4334838.1 HNH endonuclease [Streptococcus suis]
MSKENWKDIVGYEGYYQVSDFGRVRSLDREITKKDGRTMVVRGRVMEGTIKDNGYIQISLWKENKGQSFYLHRLVILAFSDSEPLETVNHIDGNKRNNNFRNLEWASYRDNNVHAIKNGLNSTKHRRNKRGSIPVLQFDLNANLVKQYPSMRQAHRETGIDCTAIGHSIKKGWKAGGYIWKYAE